MTSVFIQIPCFNEELTLPRVVEDIKQQSFGEDIDIKIVVIDDGSTDKTSHVAEICGVDFILKLNGNHGLATAFMSGIEFALKNGADIIVNTDGDHQYPAKFIKELITPILKKNADISIGIRPIETIEHFSPLKKLLQKLGSWVVAKVSNTNIKDAPSGFRAYSRFAASQMAVFNSYTYTLETIIQAGQSGLKIEQVPIHVNDKTRESRLMNGIGAYLKRSIVIIVRIFVIYRPFLFFFSIGLSLLGIGMILGFRFLYFFLIGDGDGHIQSLILMSVLLGIGFQTILVSFLADIISANRKLLSKIISNQFEQYGRPN